MMIEILPDENDDLEFFLIIEKILKHFVGKLDYENVYVVKIDNWFDAKWRLFAGKFLGIAGVRSKELVMPPFNPNRVLEQSCFIKKANQYEKREAQVHYFQPSEQNLIRKIRTYSEPKIFFWYSGNSKKTSRGSCMIYEVEKEKQSSTYISFLKKDAWQIYKTDQISRNEILSLIQSSWVGQHLIL